MRSAPDSRRRTSPRCFDSTTTARCRSRIEGRVAGPPSTNGGGGTIADDVPDYRFATGRRLLKDRSTTPTERERVHPAGGKAGRDHRGARLFVGRVRAKPPLPIRDGCSAARKGGDDGVPSDGRSDAEGVITVAVTPPMANHPHQDCRGQFSRARWTDACRAEESAPAWRTGCRHSEALRSPRAMETTT